MPILVSLLVLAVVVPFLGPRSSIPPLDQVTADYVAAFNAKDSARVASLYTEDGELMAPGSSPIKGSEAIESALQSTFQRDNTLALTPVESQTMGARAYDAGTFALTLDGPTDTGVPEIVGGRYLTVFKRAGDAWKIAYHMFYVDSTPVSEP